jgi:CRP-like cAMP-binding protein
VLGGTAEVVRETPDCEVRVGMLVEGDIFGEMALFEREVRSATVRAIGGRELDEKLASRRASGAE